MTLGTSLSQTIRQAQAALDHHRAARSAPVVLWQGLSEADAGFGQRVAQVRGQLLEGALLLAVTSHAAPAIEGARQVRLPAKLFVLFHPENPQRYRVASGGRGSGKSWSIATALVLRALTRRIRILCCREVMRSLRESVHHLLEARIDSLGLTRWFDVREHSITCLATDAEIIYEGLHNNPGKVKSLEDIGLAYIEEAESISDRSLETLIPTVRAAGSEIWLALNPDSPEDPVYKRFIANQPPSCAHEHVIYSDNPWFPAELDLERSYLQTVDDDAYQHVWLGKCRQVSDAVILRGKFEVAEFDVRPEWSGPHHGLDYGFSRDPSAAVRLYVDDVARVLYVAGEFWALGVDIDALPGVLEAAIPGISRHVLQCDAARPESTSYLARNGIANARSAAKWAGSVDDGIAYLRSFAKIVVHPRCVHFLDECRAYSFRVDRLSGLPLAEPEDKNNHLIDATRYALVNLIRNQPSGTHFSHRALLLNGEPADRVAIERPSQVFSTIATCERPGTAVAIIHWAIIPWDGTKLRLLDFDLVEIEEALTAEWLGKQFERAHELRREWNAVGDVVNLHCEEGALYDALAGPLNEWAQYRTDIDLIQVDSADSLLRGQKLDERADAIRTIVNGQQLVKIARSAYARQVTHRSVVANHLVSQVLGFRLGARDAAAELVAAFTLGVLLAVPPES